jgi:hypothetical protein
MGIMKAGDDLLYVFLELVLVNIVAGVDLNLNRVQITANIYTWILIA